MDPADIKGWTLTDSTDTRASISDETHTVEFFSYCPVSRSSDVHTILETYSVRELLVLHYDGLYSVPADAPIESFTSMTALENPVLDKERREAFFTDAHDAAAVHPAGDLITPILTQSLERLINPPEDLPAEFGLVDLGCGRADRLVAYADEHPESHALGVDFKPPLFAPSANVRFLRASVNDALRKLIDLEAQVHAINADFLFGNLETGSPEELLDNVTELLAPEGEFTVSTLKILANPLGEQLAQAGFSVGMLETDEGFNDIRTTQSGKRILDKFLASGLSRESDQTPVRLIATKQ